MCSTQSCNREWTAQESIDGCCLYKIFGLLPGSIGIEIIIRLAFYYKDPVVLGVDAQNTASLALRAKRAVTSFKKLEHET